MRIWIIWSKDIKPLRNKAFYKRIEYLAHHHEAHLLVRPNAQIDPMLAERLHIERAPNYQSPLLSVLPGSKLRRDVENHGGLLAFYRWVEQRLGSDPTIKTEDIIYTFQNLDAHTGYRAARHGYNWVVDVLDMPDLYLKSAERFSRQGRHLVAVYMRFLYHHILKLDRAFQFANLVFITAPSLNKGFAARMIEEYGVPAERVVLTVNGVDLALCRPTGRARPADVSADFVVFYVGSLAPERGTSLLVDAIAQLKTSCPQISLVLAGSPVRNYLEPLRQRMKMLSVEDRVHVLGSIPHEQVLAWLETSQVCVYPFLKTEVLDGVMPIKLLEYLALGRACIASNLTGARVFIEDDVNGLLVPPGDVAAWAAAIERLYMDDVLRRRLEVAARPSVSRFNWDAVNGRIHARLLDFNHNKAHFV